MSDAEVDKDKGGDKGRSPVRSPPPRFKDQLLLCAGIYCIYTAMVLTLQVPIKVSAATFALTLSSPVQVAVAHPTAAKIIFASAALTLSFTLSLSLTATPVSCLQPSSKTVVAH